MGKKLNNLPIDYKLWVKNSKIFTYIIQKGKKCILKKQHTGGIGDKMRLYAPWERAFNKIFSKFKKKQL